MSTLLRAIDSPRRREILRLVWERERSAGEIHRSFGDVTFGAVSQHLRLLEGTGLVACRRDGRRRMYLARREELGVFREWLEASWSSSLGRLQVEAELEAARRGPRARTRKARTRKTRTRRGR